MLMMVRCRSKASFRSEASALQHLIFLFFCLSLLMINLPLVSCLDPATPCTSSSDCDSGYDCRFQRCTRNPYERGCLVQKMGPSQNKNHDIRICNSDDEYQLATGDNSICRQPLQTEAWATNHLELRMHSQNWESAFFEVWILQIILSELLDVPTTIETGTPAVSLNFYDPHAHFDTSGKSSDYDATVKAHQVGDCRLVKYEEKQKGDNDEQEPVYESCAHTVTEVWDAETKGDVLQLVEEGILEKPQILGVLGEEAFFVPKFTLERDPTLLSYIGLAGEHNRRKVAEAFLRPTSWGDYCLEVSPDNCTTNNGIAAKAPSTLEDATRYFAQGQYTGHFRNTTQNDCDIQAHNCTGHIAE